MDETGTHIDQLGTRTIGRSSNGRTSGAACYRFGIGEPAEFGKNRTVSTSDMGQALVQPGLCPIEVHLNLPSGRSWAPRQTRAGFCIS
ncbi:hypothetical protein ALO65_200333 [Pseudomonas syringae pv. papulans]|nr:hypothetical protein ALO65_200333 [Pseudomonas syringae pv. papulans]